MNNITITLTDGSRQEFQSGVNSGDIAKSISEGLFRNSIAAKVNGKLVDLNLPISDDAELEIVTTKSPEAHEILLHSAAHLMAQAVKELWPEAQVTIGPALEDRFYYDIDLEEKFNEENLAKIEAKMKEISKRKLEIKRSVLSRNAAVSKFRSEGEYYKVELIEELPEGEEISLYSQGDWADLCRGPHLPHTGFIKNIKLLSAAGAYWRGDENNKMLQRIYGTSFFDKKELKHFLYLQEEAKKRDHRKLGRELEIFTFDEEVGPGLPLWLPNGTVIADELENLAKKTEEKAGYKRVRTPHLTKGILYEKSGHLEHYKKDMYPGMEIDGMDYYVKPMNCPHHHKIYASSPRSFRDLPLRLAEYGTCYRYEKSGQLFGLMRVRSMQMNDAHIYCTPEQFKDEFLAVCRMYFEYFEIFGIEKYLMRYSLHNKEGLGNKFVNEPELWVQTEAAVRDALQSGGFQFVEVEGEAAFYGPKIDVQVWSAIGKEFTLATNQVDFAVPARFGLKYMDSDGEEKTPLCIHRAPLSTHERMIGFLLEHFGGEFPLWLAPVQVQIIPISEKYFEYAKHIHSELIDEDIRSNVDTRNEKIGAKIRKAELSKIPVMLIVGEKEEAAKTVSLRKKHEGDLGAFAIEDVIRDLKNDIKSRKRRQSYS